MAAIARILPLLMPPRRSHERWQTLLGLLRSLENCIQMNLSLDTPPRRMIHTSYLSRSAERQLALLVRQVEAETDRLTVDALDLDLDRRRRQGTRKLVRRRSA